MINKAAGIGLLALQILCFGAVFLILMAGVVQNVDPMVERSIPFVIQTASNLVFSTILFHNRKKVGSMMFRFVSVLLLATSLQNLRLFSLYSIHARRAAFLQVPSTSVFLFASILAALMFCGLGLIPQAKSLLTVSNYIALAVFASLSLVVFGPRAVDVDHLRTVGIYRVLVVALYLCAFLNLLVESFNRRRGGGLVVRLSRGALLLGSFLLTVLDGRIAGYLGAALYAAGEAGFSLLLLSKLGSLAASDIADRPEQIDLEDLSSAN